MTGVLCQHEALEAKGGQHFSICWAGKSTLTSYGQPERELGHVAGPVTLRGRAYCAKRPAAKL